jgi:hypothetical protein
MAATRIARHRCLVLRGLTRASIAKTSVSAKRWIAGVKPVKPGNDDFDLGRVVLMLAGTSESQRSIMKVGTVRASPCSTHARNLD